MKNIFLLGFVCFFALILGTSCDEGDKFSSDPALRLEFSTDTVRFDTLFSTIGSPTRQFKIYNRNSNSLTIGSIELRNATKSGFKINIDGEKGTKLSNVDILKKDSLFAFVEITVDPLNTNIPILVKDTIEFTTNGNIQRVILEAVGQDVIIWNEKIISSDTILTGDKPFLIYDSIVVKENATLTMKEGTKLYFHQKASLKVHGTIKAEGTIGKPIVMRGDRFDYMEGNIPFNNASGQWSGVYIHSESYNNRLENVYIRNGVNGIMFYESNIDKKKASLINTSVHNSSATGVTAINCDIDATNCLFTNAKSAALEIIGGKYEFLHCTIANYYRWSPRDKHALFITNIFEATKQIPLVQCNIANSIIYGTAQEELALAESLSAPFNYQFKNCLIKKKEETGNVRFTNIIWNEDPVFKVLNKEGNYAYNFDIQSKSKAINGGDKTISASTPNDLRGNPRLNDSAPDMGCYEWLKDEDE